MAASVTNTDIKASGEIAVNPLFSRKEGAPSDSSLEKDKNKGIHSARTTGADDGTDLPTYTSTFQGDQSFYTPIEQYEGKHRYDPDFEWGPKEEKKLVRKVCKSILPQTE